MIRVFYNDNALYIDGIRQAMVAGSLMASASGNTISISPLDSAAPLAVGDYSSFARADGSGFASVTEAMAYFAVQFGMRRPLGFVFTQSTPATMWNVVHGLNFFPNVTIIDTTGEQIVGALAYVDQNTLTVSFGFPSNGTAYLS